MSHDFQNLRWDDLLLGKGLRTTGAAAVSLSNYNSTGIYVWRYTTGKEAFFDAQMPHGWDKGTIKPHVHRVPDTTETYTGTWDMDYVWCNPTTGTAVSAEANITGAISGAKTAYQMQTTDITDITLTAPAISALLMIRLGLTLSAGTGAFLFGFDIHFARNRPGTINAASEP